MAEKSHTSSMTSVTEEETMSDSDTTESYTNITSSLLSSTDTDDKLTPELTNISISKSAKQAGNPPKRRKCKNTTAHDLEGTNAVSNDFTQHGPTADNYPLPRSESTGFIFPYGSNPLPLGKVEDRNSHSPLDGVIMSKPGHKFHSAPNSYLSSHVHDNSDDKSSTNHSYSSSCAKSNYSHGDGHFERPYHPDWGCAVWYQARCFDHYWKHYSFVMEWYQQHVKAVKSLQHQPGMPWAAIQAGTNYSSHKKRPGAARRRRHSRNIRKKKKARNTLLSRRADSHSMSDSSDRNKTSNGDGTNGNSEEDGALEMEITDEMAQFIKTSLMHKMERDNMKKNTGETKVDDSDVEIARTGQQNPSTAAPTEQPGTRRAAELKDLYGAGAAMIHGMETALQMTYDRHLDRFKPRLWPNVPLKMVFS